MSTFVYKRMKGKHRHFPNLFGYTQNNSLNWSRIWKLLKKSSVCGQKINWESDYGLLFTAQVYWSSCHIYTIILLLKRLATSEWIFIHTTDMQLHIGLPVLYSRSTLLAQINTDVYLREFAGKFVFAIFKLHSWFFAISRMLRLLTKWRKLASARECTSKTSHRYLAKIDIW